MRIALLSLPLPLSLSLSLFCLASVRQQQLPSPSPSALGYMALHLFTLLLQSSVWLLPSPVWTVNQLEWGNCGQLFSVFVLAACHVSGTKTVRIRLAIEDEARWSQTPYSFANTLYSTVKFFGRIFNQQRRVLLIITRYLQPLLCLINNKSPACKALGHNSFHFHGLWLGTSKGLRATIDT